MEPYSNFEWKAWGKQDPLYGVAIWPGKEIGTSDAWKDEDFYKLGETEWPYFLKSWKNYTNISGICLEIGCGAGRFTKQLATHFSYVHATDISPDIIQYARQRIETPNISFHQVDGISLPLPDETVNGVFSTHVFQHFDPQEVAINNFNEIYRVLQPGGSMMIHLPVAQFPRYTRLFRNLYSTIKWIGDLRVTLTRKLMSMNLAKPIMRELSYEPNWLFNHLDFIGFNSIEIRFIVIGSAHSFVPVVFATKPKQ